MRVGKTKEIQFAITLKLLCSIQNIMSMFCETKPACIVGVIAMHVLVQIVRKDWLANKEVTHHNILCK
jgi:hypothetical protein